MLYNVENGGVNMIDLANNVAIGLLTNTIYDIAKYAGSKFFNPSRGKARELRVLVENKIFETFPEDLSCLFESSTFVSYFDSPQFLDITNAYVEHKIICNYTSENTKIQKHVKKGGIISADDVINYIGTKICGLYEINKAISVPSKATIIHGVAFILSVTESVIAENLSPEASQVLYLINSRTDMLHGQIISMLTKSQRTIEQIQAKQLSPHNDDYEEIKSKYHSILKEKNSEAHIYLLDKFPFDQFYVPPVLENSSAEHMDISMYAHHANTAWKDIWANSNIIYLTGGAGYGKSLFTKKIINNYKDLNIFHINEYLVIYGELKSFYPNGSDNAISVVEFLKNSIKSSTLMEVSTDFVEHYLNAGRCIILLDALDEVEKSKRIYLHESVIAFFKSQNPNNKICLTSRDRGFIPERNVEVFKICRLNEEQIEKYVDKIIALRKFEKADKETFMKQTEVLVRKGFLNSFLVLSLLINIYKAERELPENKLELYQKCFEYIANKREKDKTQKEFDWKVISPIMKDNTFIELSRLGLPNNSNIDRSDIKERLLQIYKTKYGSEAETENAIDEFLKFCSDRTELFVPTTEAKYKFFHRSFFEYFYSLYIFLRCTNAHDMLEELLNFDVDSEVFELTVAMLKQKSEERYQALIELMFEQAEKELRSDAEDFSVLNVLILSMQVIDDVLYRKRFLQTIIENKDAILKNLDSIHNLRLISSIYESDTDSYQVICDSYYNEYLLFLFDSCDKIFKMAEQYSKETKDDFFENALNKNHSIGFRRHFVYRYVDADKNFYVPIISKMVDSKKILLDANKESLTNIFKKTNPRNFPKKASNTMAIIDRYKKFSEEDQNRFLQLILSFPYVMR